MKTILNLLIISSRSFLLRMRNVSDQSREYQITFDILSFFFQKLCILLANVEKIM